MEWKILRNFIGRYLKIKGILILSYLLLFNNLLLLFGHFFRQKAWDWNKLYGGILKIDMMNMQENSRKLSNSNNSNHNNKNSKFNPNKLKIMKIRKKIKLIFIFL